MKKNNYILYNGENLVHKAKPKKIPGGPRQEVYTYEESAERLYHQLEALLQYISQLPKEATPQEKVIFSLYVHPAYIAKSYFPSEILKYISASTVGSKAAKIEPTKQLPKQEKTLTTQFYILVTKSNIEKLKNDIFSFEKKEHQKDIQTIESITPFYESDKIKFSDTNNATNEYEIVFHASNTPEDSYILREFNTYNNLIGNRLTYKFVNNIDGLTFVYTTINADLIEKIASYTFIRAIRKAPTIRDISQHFPHTILKKELSIDKNQIDKNIKVAIFDGGFDRNSFMNEFVDYRDMSGNKDIRYISHGHAVTSAYLFGSIKEDKILTPYSLVTNYRVLDNTCTTYEILTRIENVLKYENIEFINLSIGPNQEVEDDDVHYWTALLDKYFSTGQYFACIAVGNMNSRIQIPSDCVNAMSIGAANSDDFVWERAHYSNFGPGRIPGFIKPDGVAFGGDKLNGKMFKVFDEKDNVIDQQGTSFSSPLVLRSAVGIRSLYGNHLLPITLKAILIHHAEEHTVENQVTVGWGRFNLDVEDMMTCHDHQVKLIYQGKINVKEYYHAEIPFPDIELEGNIKIKATFCFSSSTDAEHPPSYTNYGLVATFIPHNEKKSKKPDGTDTSNNATDTFFTPSTMYDKSEDSLRKDSHKWETVLHSEKIKRASSLKKPYFEIKYHEREKGADSNKKGELSYALVVTIESEQGVNIYNNIYNKYQTQLTSLEPRIQQLEV